MMSIKIAIHSDLHFEGQYFEPGFLSDSEYDILVLSGDIVTVRDPNRIRDCFREIRMKVGSDKPILFVYGNHEFYKGESTQKTKNIFKKILGQYDITILDRDVFEHGDYVFIGCTGWSTLDAYPEFNIADVVSDCNYINDFRLCPGWTVDKMVRAGEHDRRFIKRSLLSANQNGKFAIVVTHFPLFKEFNNKRFSLSPISSYFVNDWYSRLDMKKSPCILFISGHTHGQDSMLRTSDSVFVCNQKGYRNENPKYDPNFIYEI